LVLPTWITPILTRQGPHQNATGTFDG
jgi:hypothetical protein